MDCTIRFAAGTAQPTGPGLTGTIQVTHEGGGQWKAEMNVNITEEGKLLPLNAAIPGGLQHYPKNLRATITFADGATKFARLAGFSFSDDPTLLLRLNLESCE